MFAHIYNACDPYGCRYISRLQLCIYPLLLSHPPIASNNSCCYSAVKKIPTMSTASSSKSFKCALCNEAFVTRGQRDYHRHRQCALRNMEKVCGCCVTQSKHVQTMWLARRIQDWLSQSLGPALLWFWMVTEWKSLRMKTQ